jgi:hypothetical protein
LLESHVVKLVKLSWLVENESELKILPKTTPEVINLALLIRNVLLGITSEVLKLSMELLTHSLSNTCRNVVSSEVTAKLGPADLSTLLGVLILLPPICCLVLELKRCKLDIILGPDIAALKVFVYVSEPIISVERLSAETKGLVLIAEKLIE